MQSVLDKYFSPTTMSLHVQVGIPLAYKQGRPGNWVLVEDNESIVTQQDFDTLVQDIFKEVLEQNSTSQAGNDRSFSKTSFLEIDHEYYKVIQHGHYRIVIVYPPLARVCEMTVVKPIVRLQWGDYKLDERVQKFLTCQAQGILIAGSPGSGKTTFAQAFLDVFVAKGKIVKTLESPRDLDVPPQVAQYSFMYGSHDEVRNILLLSRPDVVVYDEVRNQSDFFLFKDLRLAGIGLIGVIHATKPVDALQRFLGVIDMGIIPQVVDTIVYMQGGEIAEILQLSLVVKVPHGMLSEDLARPVIVVSSFLSGKVLYEVYSYGEQVVVVPLDVIEVKRDVSPLLRMAAEHYFAKKYGPEVEVDFISSSSIVLTVPSYLKGEIIGKGGERIMRLEQELGCHIDVKTKEEDYDYYTPGKKKKKKKKKR